jgi:hypothetical protein
VSKGTTTLLRTNKNKVITIENEQKRKKKGTEEMKMYKRLKRGAIIVVANE